MVTRRRREKQCAVVCGLPLTLTLPDGSTVAVRPMSDAQLLQTLNIRSQAESLGLQPGLGITRCLNDDDFRSEVKGAHKFAITMVKDATVSCAVGETAVEAEHGEGGGCRSKQVLDRYGMEESGMTREMKAMEEVGVRGDVSKVPHFVAGDKEIKQYFTCYACSEDGRSNGLSSKIEDKPRAFQCVISTTETQTKSKNDESVCNNGTLGSSHKEAELRGSSGLTELESSVSSDANEAAQGTRVFQGFGPAHPGSVGGDDNFQYKQASSRSHSGHGGQVSGSKVTITSGRVLEKRSHSDRSKKTKKPSGSKSSELLVASVILTNSKYYRGPSIVTPWSFVSPAHSGRGLDSLCLSISEYMAKRLGFWGMYLDMLVSDSASVALMERKAGYTRVGTLPHVEMDTQGQPVGCHVYYKDLRTTVSFLQTKTLYD